MPRKKETKKLEKNSTGKKKATSKKVSAPKPVTEKKERPQNKNLIPGANKNGRPKGKLNFDTRVDMAINFLAEQYVIAHNAKKENKNKQITIEDVDIEGDIFAQLLQKARSGDTKMIDSFLDRRHGKATTRIELGGLDGDPIQHEVRVTEAKEKARGMLSKWLKK